MIGIYMIVVEEKIKYLIYVYKFIYVFVFGKI